MLDNGDLLNIIKKAALDAVNAAKPVNVVIGTVIDTSPLRISIDQKLNLTDPQLILTRNVTDYSTKITDNGVHQQITVHNALAISDEVVMIRIQGGQKYIVLDVMKT